jgi:gamma-glutamylcyclotransferase (GGCT)/AIG2-like uncharacterized protein YtfP
MSGHLQGRTRDQDVEPRTQVFVYGTLLAGESNHRYLAHARLITETKTVAAFRLYDLGPYPGLVEVGSDAVLGEVYDVDEPTLATLDRLEGHPRFYVRKSIVLESGATVQTYLLMPHQVVGRPIITSGSWRVHRKGILT